MLIKKQNPKPVKPKQKAPQASGSIRQSAKTIFREFLVLATVAVSTHMYLITTQVQCMSSFFVFVLFFVGRQVGIR